MKNTALVLFGALLFSPGFVQQQAHAADAALTATREPLRLWNDASGKKSAQAALVDVRDGTVFLRTASGKAVRTSLDRLSEQDRAYVARFVAARTTKPDRAPHAAANIPATAAEPAGSLVEKALDTFAAPYLGLLSEGMQKLPFGDLASAVKGPTELPSNLIYVRVSRDFLQDFVRRSVERDEPVRDSILGTAIIGQSHTSGTINLVLQPARDDIVADLVFSGSISAITQGYNGPVVLHNTAQTPFQAYKRIVVTNRGVEMGPAVAYANTRSSTDNIDTNLPGLRRKIAEQTAWRRVYQSRAQGDAIASQHVAARIQDGLDAEAGRAVDAVRQKLATALAEFPRSYDQTIPSVHLNSTRNYVQIVLFRPYATAVERRLFPPPFTESAPITLRVHRSVLGGSNTAVALRHTLNSLLKRFNTQAGDRGMASLVSQVSTNRNISLRWSEDHNWILIDYNPRGVPTQPAVAGG